MKILLDSQITSSNLLDFDDLSPGDVFIMLSPKDLKYSLPFPFTNIAQNEYYIFIFVSCSILPSGKSYSYLRYELDTDSCTLLENKDPGPYKVIKLDATLNIKGFL